MAKLRRKKDGFRVSNVVLICSFGLFGSFYMWISASLETIIQSSKTAVIHDPHFLKNNPISFSAQISGVCDVPPGEGEEGPAGILGLNKIKSASNGVASRVKILCMVYTHSNRHDVLRSIAETYAQDCDGFMAASNVTDQTIGAFALPHIGPESYDNMWNKIQAMWYYAHQNYLLDFDWFHIGGDDMYLIPDNIRRIAAKFPPDRPWLLGASIPNSKNPARRFCGGGAGYTMNRRALHLLIRRFVSGDCPAAIASDEDVRLSRCLEDAHVKCQDTNDDQEEVRYHHLDAQFHAAWIPTRHSLWLWKKLQHFHNIRGNQTKLAQISNTSISFHLDKGTVRSKARDRGIRRYHAILYDLCSSDFVEEVSRSGSLDKEEKDQKHKIWKVLPKAGEALYDRT